MSEALSEKVGNGSERKKLLRVVVDGKHYLASEVLSISDSEIVIKDMLGNIVVIKRDGHKESPRVDIIVAD